MSLFSARDLAAILDGSAPRSRRSLPEFMSPIDFFELLRKHFSSRRRRIWLGNGRAHVELRHGTGEQLRRVADHLATAVDQLPEHRWVEVHASTRRAVPIGRAHV